jgi:uncharacterized damage-inducible protein DinB
MSADIIKSQYRYNVWTTEKLLAITDQLTTEEWQNTHAGGHGSIRDTLVHALNVHLNWMNFFDGSDPDGSKRRRLDPVLYPDPASIRSLWGEVKTKSQRFLDQLDDAQANAVRTIPMPDGDLHFKLWKLMAHAVTHTVQHNTEIAEALTGLGRSPGDLDYLFYILEQ